MSAIQALVGLVLGYLFASFPTGYFAGRLYGVDVRRHGSRRTGGTNVLRAAGWPAFVITVLGDALKGVIPVLLMRGLFGGSEYGAAFAVLGVVLGNNWSAFVLFLPRARAAGADLPPPPNNAFDQVRDLFARAKGGAGVTATAGAALALFWPPVILLILVGIPILILGRYASLASITVAILYPMVMGYYDLTNAIPPVYFLISLAVGAIVLYVHIPNMRRLAAGSESKFGQRLGAKPAPDQAQK